MSDFVAADPPVEHAGFVDNEEGAGPEGAEMLASKAIASGLGYVIYRGAKKWLPKKIRKLYLIPAILS